MSVENSEKMEYGQKDKNQKENGKEYGKKTKVLNEVKARKPYIKKVKIQKDAK